MSQFDEWPVEKLVLLLTGEDGVGQGGECGVDGGEAAAAADLRGAACRSALPHPPRYFDASCSGKQAKRVSLAHCSCCAYSNHTTATHSCQVLAAAVGTVLDDCDDEVGVQNFGELLVAKLRIPGKQRLRQDRALIITLITSSFPILSDAEWTKGVDRH
eukprot:653997-Rhodomonas_salina.1